MVDGAISNRFGFLVLLFHSGLSSWISTFFFLFPFFFLSSWSLSLLSSSHSSSSVLSFPSFSLFLAGEVLPATESSPKSTRLIPFSLPNTRSRDLTSKPETSLIRGKPIRPRRRPEKVERLYDCEHSGCDKSYGTLAHLNAHIRIHRHGKLKTPEDYEALRQKLKEKKAQLKEVDLVKSVPARPQKTRSLSEKSLRKEGTGTAQADVGLGQEGKKVVEGEGSENAGEETK